MAAEVAGSVWAATWVPAASPIAGFGESGYAVAWIDLADGRRVQVLVDGTAPTPGTTGRIERRPVGEATVELFVPEGAA